MKPPRFTDKRPRYRDAAETAQPGYLSRRFKAYRRLQKMQAARSSVTPLKRASK